MSYEPFQIEPMILLALSIFKWAFGNSIGQIGCLGFEVAAVVFLGIMVLFAVNVTREIALGLGIKILTV